MLNLTANIESFINKFIDLLKADAPKNSGNLANSFNPTLNITTDKIEIGIDAANYAKFIDLGVNGSENNYGSPFTFTKPINTQAISPFAKSIGASPFALSKSIYKKGIKPRHFGTTITNNQIESLGDTIIEGIWDDYYEKEKEQ